jgi:hypothetical protein
MGASTVADRPSKHGGVRKGAGRPPSESRKEASVRIDSKLLAQARMVSSRRGVSLADYLASLLRGPVDRDFLKEMKDLENGVP